VLISFDSSGHPWSRRGDFIAGESVAALAATNSQVYLGGNLAAGQVAVVRRIHIINTGNATAENYRIVKQTGGIPLASTNIPYTDQRRAPNPLVSPLTGLDITTSQDPAFAITGWNYGRFRVPIESSIIVELNAVVSPADGQPLIVVADAAARNLSAIFEGEIFEIGTPGDREI